MSPLLTRTFYLHEVVIDVEVAAALLVVLAHGLQVLQGHEVDLVLQEAADATETTAELSTLLALVGDELQGATELLVVLGKPIHQLHLLDVVARGLTLGLVQVH
eukprot:304361_1